MVSMKKPQILKETTLMDIVTLLEGLVNRLIEAEEKSSNILYQSKLFFSLIPNPGNNAFNCSYNSC